MVLIEVPAEPVANTPPPSAADLPDTVGDSQLANSFEEAATWFDEEDTPGEAAETKPLKTKPAASKPTQVPSAKPQPAPEQVAVAAAANVTPPSSPPPPGEQPGAMAANAPLMPGDSWTSAATQNTKRILLVVCAGVVGVVAVIGLAVLVTSWGSDDETPPQVASVEDENPVESPTPIDDPPEVIPEVVPPEPAPPSEPAVEPIPEIDPPAEPDPVPSPTEVEDPPSLPDPEEAIPAPLDPLESVPPEEPPLFTEDPPTITPPANSGLDALDALLPLLDGPPPETVASLPAPPEEGDPPSDTRNPLLDPEAPPEEPVENQEPVKPEPRLIDVQARLADPIEAIEFPATSLVDFFRLMSDFSTIPITLDPVALTQLKISPDDQIAVVLGKTTVGEVLRRAASRKNLVVEIEEDRITITHNRDASGTLRQAKYTVSDLLGRAPQELDALKQLVVTHVAPGSWQETGGVGEIESMPGALLIRHTEPVHHAVVMFIEKLRLARGKDLRSQYDPRLFDRDAMDQSIGPKLSGTVSLNYFENTRLVDIIERMESIAGIRISLDWNALLAEGWTPDTEARLSVTEAPLGETLDQLLTPRGLTYRVISPTWIQITTPAGIASERVVEFHPAADVLQRKDWQPSDLQAAVLAGLPVAEGAVRPVLGFDTASNSLIVSGSVDMQDAVKRLIADL